MRYLLLTSTFMLLSYNYANASNNDFEVNLGTHTHLPQLELNSPPLNSDGTYKTARVCSLANENCEDNFGFNKADKDNSTGAKKCRNKGYSVTSCAAPYILTDKCPDNQNYYKSCTCPTSWKSCTKPQYGVGTACSQNAQTLYASCQTDNNRACSEDGYSSSCTSPQKPHASNKCPWNSSYVKCCSPSACASGYSTTCSGTVSGNDGCGYECKKCCDENCPAGTSENNPGGCGGSTRNGCNTKTCFYPYKACCSPSCDYPDCAEGQEYVRAGGSDGCGGRCPICTWKSVGSYTNCSANYRNSYGSYCFDITHGYILYNGSLSNPTGGSPYCYTRESDLNYWKPTYNCGARDYW